MRDWLEIDEQLIVLSNVTTVIQTGRNAINIYFVNGNKISIPISKKDFVNKLAAHYAFFDTPRHNTGGLG